MHKFVIACSLFAVALANSGGYRSAPSYAPASRGYSGEKYDAPAYQYQWRVRAGSDGYGKQGGYGGGESAEFGQSESRYGDKTEGRYFVELPDGRLQTVDYIVDGYSGFVAKVSYEGEAKQYEQQQAAYRPAAPARPLYRPPAY